MRSILSISLLFVLLLAACSEENAGTESESSGDQLKEMDIMLDWYPNAVHSYLYVAKEQGYFKEEGLDVNIKFPANPTDPINLAAAGKIDLGISYQPDVIIARANENVPVKSIAAIVRSPLNRVVFKEDSSIQTPRDLEGKKVGYPGIPLNEAIINTMVKTNGGDPSNVNTIDVGFELGSSIISEQADAVVGAYINHEVPVLENQGHETRHLNPTEYGVPSFYELVFVTNDQTFTEKEEDIRAFWRAASKGYQFTEENPEEALQVLLSNQDQANFPLNEEVEKQSLKILLPKMETEDEAFGSQSKQSWMETAEWLKNAGLIDTKPNLDDIFVNLVE